MAEMSPKQRVLCAFRGGVPDRVPMYDFLYSRKLYKEVIGRVPEYYNGEDTVRCAAEIGCDFVVIPLGGLGGLRQYAESADVYQDEWGTTYRQDADVSWPADAPIEFPLTGRDDWQRYQVPDPSLPGRLAEVETALKVAKDNGFSKALVHYQIGLSYAFSEKWEKARESLDKAIAADSGFAHAYYYRGLTWKQLKRTDQMMLDLDRFLKLAPKAKEASTARSLLKAGGG